MVRVKLCPFIQWKCVGEWRSWLRWVVSFNFRLLNFPYPQTRRLGGPQSIWLAWRKNVTPAKTRTESSVVLAIILTTPPIFPPPPKKLSYVVIRLWESLKCTMLVAVMHAGHTLQSLKRQGFGTEMCSYNYALNLYTCVAFLVLPIICVRHALICLISFYTVI
jgi:hypothetical protein